MVGYFHITYVPMRKKEPIIKATGKSREHVADANVKGTREAKSGQCSDVRLNVKSKICNSVGNLFCDGSVRLALSAVQHRL